MKKKLVKTLKITLLLGICFCLAVVLGARLLIVGTAKGRTYSDVEHIPHRPVGFLLGCSQFVPSGGQNMFFTHRVNAAATLYHHHKIDFVIVSGDNHRTDYDEATDMKDALMQQGVPEDRIFCDYAGFRTLDSVVRAKEIFGQTDITVISQEFHNQRAIFIAHCKGIDAVGFNAKDVSRRYQFLVKAREQFARVKAVWDVVLGVHPKFYGEQIEIPSVSAVEDVGMAIVEAARNQIGKTTLYDPRYVRLEYPMGDVPIENGVCSDVIVRALRDALGMDLQQLVHEDMRTSFLLYPKPLKWRFKIFPDRNIDHRRVLNLERYFERKGFSVGVSKNPEDYLPGDIVACALGGTLPHIMIVSDRKDERGIPLVIHNIGGGVVEGYSALTAPVTGHYRMTHKGRQSSLTNVHVIIGGVIVIGAMVFVIRKRVKRKRSRQTETGKQAWP